MLELQGRLLTKGIFRQIPQEDIVDDTPALNGVPWGRVWDSGWEILWQIGNDLRRCQQHRLPRARTHFSGTLEMVNKQGIYLKHRSGRWCVHTKQARYPYDDIDLTTEANSAGIKLPANPSSHNERFASHDEWIEHNHPAIVNALITLVEKEEAYNRKLATLLETLEQLPQLFIGG